MLDYFATIGLGPFQSYRQTYPLAQYGSQQYSLLRKRTLPSRKSRIQLTNNGMDWMSRFSNANDVGESNF